MRVYLRIGLFLPGRFRDFLILKLSLGCWGFGVLGYRWFEIFRGTRRWCSWREISIHRSFALGKLQGVCRSRIAWLLLDMHRVLSRSHLRNSLCLADITSHIQKKPQQKWKTLFKSPPLSNNEHNEDLVVLVSIPKNSNQLSKPNYQSQTKILNKVNLVKAGLPVSKTSHLRFRQFPFNN